MAQIRREKKSARSRVTALLFLRMYLEHTDHNAYLCAASSDRTGTLAAVNQRDVCGKATRELTE